MSPEELHIARETLVWRIRESEIRMLAVASIPAEAATLAAQQIVNVRLAALEAPKEVTWGEVAFEFVLGLVINSSFVEKFAAKMFQKVYGRLLSSQLALRVLPKSDFGKLLVADVAAAQGIVGQLTLKNIKSAGAAAQTFGRRTLTRINALAELEGNLSRELEKYAKLTLAKKEDLKLYASGITDLVMESKNAAAFVKATKDALKKGIPGKSSTAFVRDDATAVAIVEHFMSAAQGQRLHVEALHSKYQWVARTFPLTGKSFQQLNEMFSYEAILEEGDQLIQLDELRSSLKLKMEAMIWAVHLNFLRSKKTPDVNEGGGAARVIPSISEKIEQYLLDRFSSAVELFKESKGSSISWGRLSPGLKGKYLRDYFWSITDTLPK